MQLVHGKQRGLDDVIQTDSAYVEHPLRRFTQLDDPLPIGLGGSEVQVAQLGNGMADGVVISPFGDLPAMEVCYRYALQHGRLSGRQRFEAIP
ncbi:hypothetical protein D3C86_1809120 [compost metagenome]